MSFIHFILQSVVAHAQVATAPGKQPSTIEMFLPFIGIFAIFYFMMIRPQAKKQKEHSAFLAGLKRGEAVVTTSGVFGVIENHNDVYVNLEIANGVTIKVLRSCISAYQNTKKSEA